MEKKGSTRLRSSMRDEHFGEKLLIAIALFFALAVFFHFKEVRVQLLEVNATAKSYIVAQVDFQFPDDEATLVMRQEALRDIGSIFSLDEREVRSTRLDFENYLIKNRDWRSKIYKSTFEEMYNAADVVQETLLGIRLTESRTFQKMRESGVDTSEYIVVDIDLKAGSLKLPRDFWSDIRSRIVKRYQFNGETIGYILKFFDDQNWTLEEDRSSQQLFRQIIEASIPEKFSQIRAGSRVIEKGDRVTPRHLAILQAMKERIKESYNIWDPQTLLASALFSLIVTVLGILYLRFNHPDLVHSRHKLLLYVTIVILTLALAKVMEYLLVNGTNPYLDMVRYALFVPFAAVLICVLLDKQLALFTTVLLTIIMGISLSVDHSKFLFINLITGMATILFSKNLRKRKEVFIVLGKAWLSALPVVFAFKVTEPQFFDSQLGIDLLATFVCMLGTAILVVGFLPLLESLFRVMTDITLMEFLDPSNELLHRLSIEAPGTYQHSLVVGSLAEAAASAIGANGLFCRVSTMYHDIGKLFNPHYFTENQMGGFDIHQLLTPLESTQVIVAHVAEGEALAHKYSLPRPFIDIIREHHGTTLVYYFYCKQIEQLGGDVEAVNKEQFRYPGPKPRSKESAIIMIADTVEAASRSMEEASEEAVTELVDRLVTDKASEGQFDNCRLTFEELGIVKRTIVKTLTVTRHLRIKYPEKK